MSDTSHPSRAAGYDHARATWGVNDFLVSVAIYFIVGFGLALFIYVFSDGGLLPEGPWLILAAVGPHAAQFAHLLLVSRKKGVGFGSDFRFRYLARTDLRLGFMLFVGVVFAAVLTGYVISAIAGDTPVSAAVALAQESSNDGITVWILLFALFGTTLIPLVEELVFRGLFWSALEKRGVRPITVLIVTSAVFALLHLELLRTPVLFLIGLALGYGRFRTGRIGPSLVAHMSINASAMLATLLSIS